MRVYLDESALIPLIVQDALTERARALLLSRSPILVVSDFGLAEFASAMGRLVRTRAMSEAAARAAFAAADLFAARMAKRVETIAADISAASGFLRRLDLTLRAPDAIHIAMALRADAALATFDEKMAAAAGELNLELATA